MVVPLEHQSIWKIGLLLRNLRNAKRVIRTWRHETE